MKIIDDNAIILIDKLYWIDLLHKSAEQHAKPVDWRLNGTQTDKHPPA